MTKIYFFTNTIFVFLLIIYYLTREMRDALYTFNITSNETLTSAHFFYNVFFFGVSDCFDLI